MLKYNELLELCDKQKEEILRLKREISRLKSENRDMMEDLDDCYPA